jgi:hypothetical protein
MAAARALLLWLACALPLGAQNPDLEKRVTALADELRSSDRQLALEQGVADLRAQAKGLPHVSEAVQALAQAPDVAWRAYACSLLAEELD